MTALFCPLSVGKISQFCGRYQISWSFRRDHSFHLFLPEMQIDSACSHELQVSPGSHALNVGHRQIQDMGEEPHPEVIGHSLGEPRQDDVLNIEGGSMHSAKAMSAVVMTPSRCGAMVCHRSPAALTSRAAWGLSTLRT